ncbi:MAG: carbohydrate ABC transporter permease [Caldisphaera sp.]
MVNDYYDRRKLYGSLKILIMLIVLVIFAVYAVFPILWMLLMSFETTKEIYSFPPVFPPKLLTLQNYKDVFQMNVPLYLFNSTFVTVISTVLDVLLGSLAGYTLGRFEFKLKKMFVLMFIILLALPYAMYILPLFVMELDLNIVNTYWSLILPYTALNLPWAVLIMQSSFEAIPQEIEDASRIDGCGYGKAFWNVMFPLARQGIIIAAIFTFINIWSDLLFVEAYISSNSLRTFPSGLLIIRAQSTFAYAALAPSIIISILPTLAIFLILQNYFVKGAIEGGLK